MTGLTHLQLFNTALNSPKDSGALSPLRLQELSLVDCPNAISAILASGACRGLKTLHIDYDAKAWDRVRYGWRQEASQADDPVPGLGSHYFDSDEPVMEESEAIWLSGIIQSLTDLEELSGRSRLFREGMSDFLKDWHKDCLQTFTPRCSYDPIIPVWQKL